MARRIFFSAFPLFHAIPPISGEGRCNPDLRRGVKRRKERIFFRRYDDEVNRDWARFGARPGANFLKAGGFIMLKQIVSKALQYVRREEGQSLVEYALIISLVAVVLIAGLNALQGGITGVLNNTVASL